MSLWLLSGVQIIVVKIIGFKQKHKQWRITKQTNQTRHHEIYRITLNAQIWDKGVESIKFSPKHIIDHRLQ